MFHVEHYEFRDHAFRDYIGLTFRSIVCTRLLDGLVQDLQGFWIAMKKAVIHW
jgi:hypothetical protein